MRETNERRFASFQNTFLTLAHTHTPQNTSE